MLLKWLVYVKHVEICEGLCSVSVSLDILIDCSLKKKEGQTIDKQRCEELEMGIMKRTAQLEEIEQTLPKPNGTYLKIILGNVNVSILNKEEK